MFEGKPICDGRIALLCAAPPFAMSEVNALLGRIAAGQEPGLSMEMPMFADARGVQMALLPTADFKAFFLRRSREGIPQTGNLLACLCADSGSFGMLRMFGILAELEGIRPEGRYCVTEDMAEATAWLAKKMGLDRSVVAEIAAEADAFRAELGG